MSVYVWGFQAGSRQRPKVKFFDERVVTCQEQQKVVQEKDREKDY